MTYMFRPLMTIALLTVFPGAASHAEPAPPSAMRQTLMTQETRESLRFHLENLLNEMTLLVQNEKIDAKDLHKQEGDLKNYSVFQAIPLDDGIGDLKAELTQSSSEHGVAFKGLSLSRARAQNPKPIPDKIYSDSQFRLSPDQVVQELWVRAEVSGAESKVKEWFESLPEESKRLIEIVDAPHLLPSKKTWQAQFRVYRFRDIRYPKLLPKNPAKLLPAWAANDPDKFAKTEPALWNYVTQIQKLSPKVTPLYSTREQFLLNDARLSFFLSKATKNDVK